MKTRPFPTIKSLSLLTAAVTGMILSAGSAADSGAERTKESAHARSKEVETGFSMAQDSKPGTVAPNGGIAAASCGGVEITQNTDPNTIVAGTVECAAGGGVTSVENAFARAYVLASPTNINCVDFAIQTSTLGAWPVRVR